MKMNKTRHFDQRTNQRGVSSPMGDLTLKIGEIKGDKYIANRKVIKNYLSELDQKLKKLSVLKRKFAHLRVVYLVQKALITLQKMRCIALKILDKGGVTIVCEGSSLITVYNTSSYKRN